MRISAKTVKRVEQCTSVNDHGGALEVAAEALGCADLVERLQSIQRQHMDLGYLPNNLYEERRNIYIELFTVARNTLSNTDYQRLHAAF